MVLFFLFFFFYLTCISILPACMPVRVSDYLELEFNPGPLEEQTGLLTAEPFLQPPQQCLNSS